jgi:tRNA (guanine10-N2)-methyltransferase
MYDPFMGTGSMAYVRTLLTSMTCLSKQTMQASAYFGAQMMGSDIDGRQMRGKGNSLISFSL